MLVREPRQLSGERVVIGGVDGRQPLLEAVAGEGSSPQRAVVMGARGDDAEPMARARTERGEG